MSEANKMQIMLPVSLWLNILVLVPVCFGLALDAQWACKAWGRANPARGILLSIYLAILILSVVLLVVKSPVLAAPLLGMQVLYKVTTPFSVGTMRNPVVLSNLGIACVHIATLVTIWPLLPF